LRKDEAGTFNQIYAACYKRTLEVKAVERMHLERKHEVGSLDVVINLEGKERMLLGSRQRLLNQREITFTGKQQMMEIKEKELGDFHRECREG